MRSHALLKCLSPALLSLALLAPGCSQPGDSSAARATRNGSGLGTIGAAGRTLVTPDTPLVIWANDGGDKVTRDELRATINAASVANRTWDGTTVRTFGARNEVVSFNLVLEAPSGTASEVSVELPGLSGPGGATLASADTGVAGLFDWTDRPIELFYVRYLQIKGLSLLGYELYDERHIPERFRRPWTGNGNASGTWADRPDADKFYPDIAVPLELEQGFDVAANTNQSIWVDIYIPKGTPAGTWQGEVLVSQKGELNYAIPVELEVKAFTLPDEPTAKTMLFLGQEDINMRYFGEGYPQGAALDAANAVRDKHFQLAHRHRVSLIGGRDGSVAMPAHWMSRLDGSLFTAANGYAGPGEGVGNNVYSIGTYGAWKLEWSQDSAAEMQASATQWADWFAANSPETEYFLYLTDEPAAATWPKVQQWSTWVDQSSGAGKALPTMSTVSYLHALEEMPALDIPTMWASFGPTAETQHAMDTFLADPSKRPWMYNGGRPATGTFMTEDDGVSLRAVGWSQYKKKIARWFFWESTYYNNFQGGTGQTNVFQTAATFGSKSKIDPVKGESGWNYSNGDGVLFYPGTDLVFPAESYGVPGPFASLRLKHWRRGLQDAEYLALAAAVDPQKVDEIVAELIPKVLWEVGVSDINDPTYVKADISWSTDPDVWEAAREALANIITQECQPTSCAALGMACGDAADGCGGMLSCGGCDDGDPCSVDTCVAGQCQSVAGVGCCSVDADCEDGDPCTTGGCAAGQCVYQALAGCCVSGADCDDGDHCTSDSCQGGQCTHDVVSGCCAADAECDDGNPCTVDTCGGGVCTNAAKADCCAVDADCDDGNVCNGTEYCGVGNLCKVGAAPTDHPACAGVAYLETFNGGLDEWTVSTTWESADRHSVANYPSTGSGDSVASAALCKPACSLTMNKGINLAQATSVSLRFARFVDKTIDAGDYVRVELWDGTSWTQLDSWSGGNGDTNAWAEESYQLPAYAGVSDFKVRFVGKSNRENEIVQIDDVQVSVVADDPCAQDSDDDGTPDCSDACASDPAKVAPGACGCGVSDVDSDGDGAADCKDGCPQDGTKTAPGPCGCGASDADADGDGVVDCSDGCPSDGAKTSAGQCGCGVADTDSDGDGTANCNDGCPSDGAKTSAGQCGCGTSDVDSDGDGTADCKDGCPSDGAKTSAGQCGCGTSDVDSDGDGTANCKDGCPSDGAKTSAGECGCGVAEGTCGGPTCGNGICEAGESCDGRSGTTACGDCPSNTNGFRWFHYCYVNGACTGWGCWFL